MDELNRKSVDEFKQSEKIPIVVVLDNIRSMHNVGSVFRTADAYLLQ
jgi:tRNA G18 (ribose-2'-O)-methylase SpoU